MATPAIEINAKMEGEAVAVVHNEKGEAISAAAVSVAKRSRASTPPPTKAPATTPGGAIAEPVKKDIVAEKKEEAPQATPDATKDTTKDLALVKILSSLLFVLVFVGLPLAVCVANSDEPIFSAARAIFENQVQGPLIGAGAIVVAVGGWKLMEKLSEAAKIKLLVLLLIVLVFGALPFGIFAGSFAESLLTKERAKQLAQQAVGPAIGAAVGLAVLGIWALADLYVQRRSAAKEEQKKTA
mmetsp:Transcript_29789/g.64471  ORF Transcript_29789/g.64471 Transcript_29789/m.64471 type:complete len:241 (-) Transcript_29789:554-1276(-)